MSKPPAVTVLTLDTTGKRDSTLTASVWRRDIGTTVGWAPESKQAACFSSFPVVFCLFCLLGELSPRDAYAYLSTMTWTPWVGLGAPWVLSSPASTSARTATRLTPTVAKPTDRASANMRDHGMEEEKVMQLQSTDVTPSFSLLPLRTNRRNRVTLSCGRLSSSTTGALRETQSWLENRESVTRRKWVHWFISSTPGGVDVLHV